MRELLLPIRIAAKSYNDLSAIGSVPFPESPTQILIFAPLFAARRSMSSASDGPNHATAISTLFTSIRLSWKRSNNSLPSISLNFFPPVRILSGRRSSQSILATHGAVGQRLVSICRCHGRCRSCRELCFCSSLSSLLRGLCRGLP